MKSYRKGSLPAPELDFGDSQLVRFYRGLEKDPAGRTIRETWQMNLQELEDHHDFIQWLFPLPQRSHYNPKAPVLSQADIDTFTSDKTLRKRILISFNLMLGFYGFEMKKIDGHHAIIPAKDFAIRAVNWLKPGNHNYLRISRILNCLVLVGLKEHARAFLDALDELNQVHYKKIGSAFSYWRAAVS